MISSTSRRRSASPSRRRRRLVVAVATGLLLAVAGPAYAFWTATSTGSYGRAQAGTLATPTVSTGSVTATSAALSWTQPFAPTAYALGQSPGTLSGCPTAPGTGSTGCTATSLTPNTPYTWTLSASYHHWVSPAVVSATTPKQSTTTTLSNITPTTGAAGTSFNATAAVTGNAGYGTPAGTVVFSLFTSATCSGTASHTSTARPLSAGSATTSFQPAAGTYYWRATYTPTDSYNLTSTSACSAAITVTAAGGTYSGIGAPVTVTSSTKDLVIPYPAGTASGDLVLLVLVNNASQSSKIDSSGWTDIASPALGGSKMKMDAWWHTAGTETSATMQIKTDSGGATAWVLTYKNMPSPAMAGVSSGTAASGSSLTPAALTTTAPNATVISLVGINAARTLSLATPQGFGLRAAVQNTGGDDRALGVADRYAASAGAVTSPTWTQGATSSEWTWITVAFTS